MKNSRKYYELILLLLLISLKALILMRKLQCLPLTMVLTLTRILIFLPTVMVINSFSTAMMVMVVDLVSLEAEAHVVVVL
jgi:hypothetical protein